MHVNHQHIRISLCLSYLVNMLSILSLVSVVNAQVSVGQISGTVTDAAGAAVPGTTVMVTSEATNAERTVTTDENGFYVVTNLPVGSYNVAAERQSFKRALKTNYNLTADARLTVDFALEPGEVTETVEVTANVGETVNTTSGELARVIDGEQVTNLALNGRNYIQLASLIPGAPLTEANQFDPVAQTTELSAEQSVNGNRGSSNNLTVDGGFNLSSNRTSQVHNVGIDFIQEVKIQTSNFSSEYGRQSGAAINVTTRAGGNRFSGSAFEFLRNDKLDARNFFSPTRRKLRFNDFGYSFGGPIIKDKFFFFGGQEWKYIRRSLDPVRRSLPTRADRAGDFSGRAGTLNVPTGYTGVNPATGATVAAGQPIPGRNVANLRLNGQPVGISTDGRAIARVYDAAEQLAISYVDRPVANNAVYELDTPFDFRQDILRLDYRFNDRHTIYGRYLHDSNELLDPRGSNTNSLVPVTPTVRPRFANSVLVSYSWLISPTLINEAKFNFARVNQDTQPLGDTWKRGTYGFQFPQLFNDGRFPEGIPEVNIQNFALFRGPSQIIATVDGDRSFSDNLTITRGKHTFKTGVLLVRSSNLQDNQVTAYYLGIVNFNTAGNTRTTGNAFADALLGNFRTYSEAEAAPVINFLTPINEAFFTDSWKVHRKLNLELGLRYQNIAPRYAESNLIANFDPALYNPARAVQLDLRTGNIVPGTGNRFNGLVRAGSGATGEDSPEVLAVPAGAPRGLYQAGHFFAPRVGFALAPFDDSRTALRGGFGVYFNTPEGGVSQRASQNPPYTSLAQSENGNLANPISGLAPFATYNAVDPDLGTSYTMNYSLSLQRELPAGFFLETAYVGNLGRHLIRRPDINQVPFDVLSANAALPAAQRVATNALRPYKGYSEIRMYISDSTSSYNALQLYVTKRKGNLRLTGSYTWSKALTDANDLGEGSEDAFNRKFSYGLADFDRRHIFVGTYTYAIPFFGNRNGFVRALLAGYEVSGITRLQSGDNFTVVAATSTGSRRADYIGGEVKLPNGERGVNGWFNTAAFAPAPDVRRGTSGRNSVVGPGLQVWDISLRKRFAITERVKAQLQADLFNAFNRANFRDLATDFGTGTLDLTTGRINPGNTAFGTITTASPGRNIQFGLKLTF
ncbi:MAG: carboxypeptidase regulatory-like domain-containing protein [Pyrinomonadaceae bacterium]|nr:carboxypeptidase regulatory-like domain-containing protein [Pyrinomonadaceae bacterium]